MPGATLRPKPACLAALLLAVTLPTASCSPGSTGVNSFFAEQEFSFALEVTSQLSLSLEGVNGTIRVTGVEGGDSLHVEGVRQAWSSSQADADEHLSSVQVVIDENPDDFLVYTDEPDEAGGRVYVVNYEIRLPDNLEVAIVNVSGDILVEFLKDNVDISSVQASITLDEMQGNVLIELVSGLIDAEATLPLDGSLDMTLNDGDITLQIPTETSADLYLEAFCCAWDIQNLTLQNEEQSPPGTLPATLSGTLGDGRGTISLAIGNGIITLIGV
ncbi:MAG: hypothetical protein PVJ64_12630 [Gemmatimonadales bacterium]|jgi:hypothetical protein